jgi:hypothetical protein
MCSFIACQAVSLAACHDAYNKAMNHEYSKRSGSQTPKGKKKHMLQHDYLLEIINQFVQVVIAALTSVRSCDDAAVAQKAAKDIEGGVSDLLDLDPSVALSLTPDSLVTMMILSGLGESISSALGQVADIYDKIGDSDTASARREQVAAVSSSFGCDPNQPPKEFVEALQHEEKNK